MKSPKKCTCYMNELRKLYKKLFLHIISSPKFVTFAGVATNIRQHGNGRFIFMSERHVLSITVMKLKWIDSNSILRLTANPILTHIACGIRINFTLLLRQMLKPIWYELYLYDGIVEYSMRCKLVFNISSVVNLSGY